MKKLIMLIILLFPLIAFGNGYKMKCKLVAFAGSSSIRTARIYRCENKEVVCYYSNESGLQCKFK